MTRQLPVLDIAPLFQGRGSAATALESQLLECLKRYGGFVVGNFSGADELAETGTAMLRFFDLPETARQAVATKETQPESTHVYRGYKSLLTGGGFAVNEMFDIGPANPRPGPDGIVGMDILSEQSQWPLIEPCSGWRAAMLDWYRTMQRLAELLLAAIARAFHLDEAALLRLFRHGNSTLRLLNYPALAAESAVARSETGAALMTDRHTDGSGLSLLWQDRPGLQAQAPDGTWFDIPATPGTVSVHLGDVLSALSDGLLPPTPHRVLAAEGARRSIGFFLEPRLDAPIRPLAQKDQPVLSEETYGAKLLARLRTYPSIAEHIPG